jgi:REP element-mobilizing transposase RayT
MPRRSPALLLVHVVWATRGRRPLLPPSLDDDLVGLIGARARDLGCMLLQGGCGPDHVHALLRLSPCVRLSDLVQRLKGGSAYDFNHRARPGSSIHWQQGYWAESFGPFDLTALAEYVREQRDRHDPSHPAERWQFGEQGEPARSGGLCAGPTSG